MGFDRNDALRRLADDDFDVLVVGGGITGCGVALDAAARGLRTALVTADDFASGTSSASSKLVHGGLRYLAQREYQLVYQALAERQRLLVNAPHLVRPLPFLIPLFGRNGVVAEGVAQAYSAALWTYDLTGGLRIGRRHRRLSAEAARGHFPDLRSDRLVASFLYWDAQVDDARLTLAVARTAVAGHGAVLANHSPVARLLETAGHGRIHGARLADGTDVRAKVVVNAGGVWAEHIAGLTEDSSTSEKSSTPRGSAPNGPLAIRPAKGVHLMVRAERLPCDYAAVLPVAADKRSVFVVPWIDAGFTYVGTTDSDYHGDLDRPTCTPDDIAYLLDAVNAWTTADLGPDDITSTWAGLRPLVRDATSERTADLSRRHRVTVGANGLVTVTGGKLTTYRQMAADTVDRVVAELGRRPTYSPTRRLAIWGAEGAAELADPAAARRLGVGAELLEHLAGRYGGEARAVIAMVAADPDLGRPLVPGLPYLRAEAIFAARYEMAVTLTDVLARRTRALIVDREATIAAAPDVARLLAPALGWSAGQVDAQVDAFVTRARADQLEARR